MEHRELGEPPSLLDELVDAIIQNEGRHVCRPGTCQPFLQPPRTKAKVRRLTRPADGGTVQVFPSAIADRPS